jgi:hypothetical protein
MIKKVNSHERLSARNLDAKSAQNKQSALVFLKQEKVIHRFIKI